MAQEMLSSIFFDLGDTLGTAECSPLTGRLSSFRVFPDAPPLLDELKNAGYRLGVISNTGEESGEHMDEVLACAGLLNYFEADLRIYSHEAGATKKSPLIFRLAAGRAGLAESPGRCLFVGHDAEERMVALSTGFEVCPSLAQLREWLEHPTSRARSPQSPQR